MMRKTLGDHNLHGRHGRDVKTKQCTANDGHRGDDIDVPDHVSHGGMMVEEEGRKQRGTKGGGRKEDFIESQSPIRSFRGNAGKAQMSNLLNCEHKESSFYSLQIQSTCISNASRSNNPSACNFECLLPRDVVSPRSPIIRHLPIRSIAPCEPRLSGT